MFTPLTFGTALLMMIISAICWGSWANTFKGVKNYRFELFYWDYAVGIFVTSLILALTMGSTGNDASSFINNVRAADLSNIGTLFAFVLVSVGVIVLRYKEPERHRGFRVPFGPVIPVLSIFFCLLLMAGLPAITWLRFFAWLIIGLAIYFLYSRKHSEFSSLS